MAPPIISPVFAARRAANNRVRERFQQVINERGITIRNRDGSSVEVDELLDEVLEPEAKLSKAGLFAILGLFCALVAWIVFVLVVRPG